MNNRKKAPLKLRTYLTVNGHVKLWPRSNREHEVELARYVCKKANAISAKTSDALCLFLDGCSSDAKRETINIILNRKKAFKIHKNFYVWVLRHLGTIGDERADDVAWREKVVRHIKNRYPRLLASQFDGDTAEEKEVMNKIPKTQFPDRTEYRNSKGQRHREDGPAIEWPDGTKYWYRNGQLHREDGPAIEWANGRKDWYRNGQLHREDGPAIEWANGTKDWYRNGQLHREDGPAIEWANGTKEWFRNGLLHREDGPAVEYANGSKWWYRNGELHREDGPAVEYADGTKEWYRNGQLHREDGPAIECANGRKDWYLNGILTTEKEVMNKIPKTQFPDRTEYRNSKGELHREDGPATEWADGRKDWCRNGQLHREDGPAVEYADGSKHWYRNGQRHREDGPAIEWANGTKWWYRNNQLHREDGPAIEWADGRKDWYRKGQRHREDGPAVEWPDGRKEFHLNGKEYTKSKFLTKIGKVASENKVVASFNTKPLEGKSYAITGKLPVNRAEAIKMIESAGGKYSKSIKRGVTLIVGKPSNRFVNSTKKKTANQRKILTIKWDDLIKEIAAQPDTIEPPKPHLPSFKSVMEWLLSDKNNIHKTLEAIELVDVKAHCEQL